MRLNKLLFVGVLAVGNSAIANEIMVTKQLSKKESDFIGTMRLIYGENMPLMPGEYINIDGDREFKGAILNAAGNTVYKNKECTYAGSYGQCTDKKSKSCTWIGKISEQCK